MAEDDNANGRNIVLLQASEDDAAGNVKVASNPSPSGRGDGGGGASAAQPSPSRPSLRMTACARAAVRVEDATLPPLEFEGASDKEGDGGGGAQNGGGRRELVLPSPDGVSEWDLLSNAVSSACSRFTSANAKVTWKVCGPMSLTGRV